MQLKNYQVNKNGGEFMTEEQRQLLEDLKLEQSEQR